MSKSKVKRRPKKLESHLSRLFKQAAERESRRRKSVPFWWAVLVIQDSDSVAFAFARRWFDLMFPHSLATDQKVLMFLLLAEIAKDEGL